MLVVNVRATAAAMLDGMKYNREKLARECIAVCDAHDRLERALAEERTKNAALAAQVAQLQKSGGMPGAGGSPFGDAFADLFKQQGTKP